MRTARPPSSTHDLAHAELAGREFRFAVPAVPSARLPRDIQSLANIWKSISDPPTQQPDLDWAAAVWTAFTAPASSIPLTPGEGVGQKFCAASIVDLPNRTPVLATVKVSFAPKVSKHAQPAIVGASARVVTDLDLMAEHLEELYLDALPQARSAQQRSAARAMWLGGNGTVAVNESSWRDLIEATCAVMGLRVEIVEEPVRHVRSVETALGAAPATAYLLVWRPMCHGAEPVVKTFQKINVGGDVVFLDEAAFPEVILEARLALIEHGLAEPVVAAADGHGRMVPAAGEERFYIKVGGGKAGDVLVDVADCGHGQWSGDVRRKAPRALMGVELLEGVRPSALFRCARCSKHRWRARF